jgi:iron complex transport system substrate-binding protein
MLSLKPDLVAVYGSQTDLRRQLERARVPVFDYRHAGLADVTITLQQLGDRIGRNEEAHRITGQIAGQLASVRARVGGRPRPRVLVVFGRERLALRAIYASGGVGFIHDMVTIAGGDNVFADVKKEAVQATTELILARRPDVILELRADPLTPDEIRAEIATWARLPSVPAVRGGRVHLISDPRTVIPGPRVGEGVEIIANALHGVR